MTMTLKTDFKPFKKRNREEFDIIMGRIDGVQYIFHFYNGYGASVVKHSFSYGYENDLWELALLKRVHDTDEWELEYAPIVDNDVLGYLTDEQVNEILKKIEAGEIGKEGLG